MKSLKQVVRWMMAIGLVAAIFILPITRTWAAEEKWWPSEWGPDDQKGSAHRVTPQRILEALKLAKEGKVYPIGQMYENGMPMVGYRNFNLMIPYANIVKSKNNLTYHDEYISGEIGQVGTQFDGLGHVGIGDIYYNGNNRHDFATTTGLKKLGIENAGVFITRGIILDIPAFKGVERLEGGYQVTLADVKGALDKQGIIPKEGDSIFLRTGWPQLWMKDNAAYAATAPGWGPEVCNWIVQQKPAMTGCDTWTCDVIPPAEPDVIVPCHHILGTKAGIYNLENMNLEQLSKDKVYEFLFILTPLPIKGATGSPGAPIAVK
ncbi:MAG: cyclase family protein [Nitrospira sp.]|nr:cyclase family protein [Nitrospira sp.]